MSSIPSNASQTSSVFTISKGRLHISGIDDPKGISVVSSVNGWIQEKTGHATKEFKLPNGQLIRLNKKSLANWLARTTPTTDSNQKSNINLTTTQRNHILSILNKTYQKPSDLKSLLINHSAAQIDPQNRTQFACNFDSIENIQQFLVKEQIKSICNELRNTNFNPKKMRTHSKIVILHHDSRRAEKIKKETTQLYFEEKREQVLAIKEQRIKSFGKELAETYQESQIAKENGSLDEHMIRFLPVMDQISSRNLDTPVVTTPPSLLTKVKNAVDWVLSTLHISAAA